MEYTPEDIALAYQQVAGQQVNQGQQINPQKTLYNKPISKDNDFMQWLFNFKEQVVGPLIQIWRGKEEVSPGVWNDGQGELVIMNENGITWASSLIASYINPVYVVSNYDENAMNWTMRKVGRVVWNSLTRRYDEFGLKKIDIPRVANEIISKIHAILLGARGDGFRKFFSSTHHFDEIKTTQLGQKESGGLGGLFKKKQQAMGET